MLHGRASIRKACHCASCAFSSARRVRVLPALVLSFLWLLLPLEQSPISRSNLPYPGAAPAQCCGGVFPHAPLDSPWWVAVCQPAHSFSERGLLFVFSWSSLWLYPSTSPGDLVCLSSICILQNVWACTLSYKSQNSTFTGSIGVDGTWRS